MTKLKINEKKDNPLLRRMEVTFEVDHQGGATPGKQQVAELLAAKLNAKTDLMVVKNYYTPFGTNSSLGLCLVYEDIKAMERAESHKVLNPKKRIGEKAKKEAEKTKEKEQPAPKAEGKPKEKADKEEPKKEKPKAEDKQEPKVEKAEKADTKASKEGGK